MYILLALGQLLHHSVALSGRTKDQVTASDTLPKEKGPGFSLFYTKLGCHSGRDL